MADPIPSLAEVLDGISNFLKAIPALGNVMDHHELQEGMNDIPAIQVYPDTGVPNTSGTTAQYTFKGKNNDTAPVRLENFIIFLDVYTSQRSHLGEDLGKCVATFDIVRKALTDIVGRPYFSLPGIKSLNWRWERVTFEYANVKYVGFRVIMTIGVY